MSSASVRSALLWPPAYAECNVKQQYFQLHWNITKAQLLLRRPSNVEQFNFFAVECGVPDIVALPKHVDCTLYKVGQLAASDHYPVQAVVKVSRNTPERRSGVPKYSGRKLSSIYCQMRETETIYCSFTSERELTFTLYVVVRPSVCL